ncbi:hypothetical protein CfE428DRAFT_4229 [Chthoniobacter flavus Ellin428]|uniref:Uncharacterized protein n=1 Tax=Chthoniobacter flavus Ellin428 TaxID=497964 RepID=B4D5P0_9BACT|nr:hypothetical protein [Chthoniobacter flavus]EDY18093.1 hypothetical protein CfE428DRAFT_4229 [Chthoniobacter flavus Ellin428]TCO93603.1 hypothetical protein EV701_104307 [Chthoniobacter flavus]
MPRLFLAALFASALSLHATEYYVDPAVGDDHANGLAAKPEGANGPMKTIARAIKAAKPGDTVNLAKANYKESAIFHNRAGEAGKPITLDGHGAMLDGADALNPDDWKEVSPGLFHNDNLLRLDDAVIQRWFFLWDGKMNHMGRTSKGLRPDFKKPADLQPGEWSFIKDPAQNGPNGQIHGAFFVKLPPGQKLADAHIAAPIRSAGVAISGDNSWITIRNINATHVYNDGYNIHGKCRDVLFEHIGAFECGDDGISAHDDCQYKVDGLVSIGNSTGIADTGDSITEYDHVYIDGILGVDLLFFGANRHAIHNGVVLSHAHTVASVYTAEPNTGKLSLTLDNVFIRRDVAPAEARVGKDATLDLQHVTMLGFHLLAVDDGKIIAQDTVFGLAPEKNGLWGAARGAKAGELLKELTPR